MPAADASRAVAERRVERLHRPEMMRDAPFSRRGPVRAETPLVLSVPHAGRTYPDPIEAERAVGRDVLEELEDRHADELIGPMVDGGAVAIVADVARAWIDLNRGEDERPGAGSPPSARAKVGLGLVPERLAGRNLWRTPPSPAQAMARIETVHRPYHQAIATALAEARARHGFALLVDCHSMPPLGGRSGAGAELVFGDRHGTSASPAVIAAAETVARARGFATVRNAPYAGAHTLARHAAPWRNVHALQLEVDRTLYLDPALRKPSPRLPEIAAVLAEIAWAALAAVSPGLPLAAE